MLAWHLICARDNRVLYELTWINGMVLMLKVGTKDGFMGCPQPSYTGGIFREEDDLVLG